VIWLGILLIPLDALAVRKSYLDISVPICKAEPAPSSGPAGEMMNASRLSVVAAPKESVPSLLQQIEDHRQIV
jgi:hypothetical protein